MIAIVQIPFDNYQVGEQVEVYWTSNPDPEEYRLKKDHQTVPVDYLSLYDLERSEDHPLRLMEIPDAIQKHPDIQNQIHRSRAEIMDMFEEIDANYFSDGTYIYYLHYGWLVALFDIDSPIGFRQATKDDI